MQRNLLITCLLTFFLIGCSSTPYKGDDEDSPSVTGLTAAEIYQDAKTNLNNANYDLAIQLYEKLEANFPYGNYATRAQMEVAFAYYKAGEYETAVLAAERFIKLHPNHANVDYAYYLRGLAGYTMTESWLGKLFNQDPTERDPRAARSSFQFFSELVKKFPKSRYAKDAVQRMIHLRNGLAKHEIHVADYYFKRDAWPAAVNRCKYIVENFQQTPAVADALALMVKSYRKLEKPKLADDALRVLEKNHPDFPELAQLKSGTLAQ
ncbi:MAG: outer membrane protein assembly factor BamD [Gammaproteobacteria bacterium]|nr:outer membrane protein assembly factor BamD [Gammaproteobacteria bacterium]MDH5651479.1 outer membrane protein assembly factor BamD [Gammaproteobacteria bacterium]